MPTLAPGTCERSPRCRQRSAGGFTLIEVMVVLIVIGVMSTALTLGVDSLRVRDDTRALQRLRLVLEATAERAAVRGRPLGVEFVTDAYRFAALDLDERWRPLVDPPLFVERVLPDGLHWAGLRVAGSREANATRLLFGTEAPEFELRVATPRGEALLVGRANGDVQLRLPGAPAAGALSGPGSG